MEKTKQSSGVVRWSLIMGIVIVVNLFFNYALSLVYKAPDYTAYFPQSQVVPNIATEQDCIAVGGQWNGNAPMPQPTNSPIVPKTPSGYCNPDFTKQQQFDAAQKHYDRNIFIALVVLGVISIVCGMLLENTVLSLSFSWGGVLSLIIASMRYWSDANNLLKVIILAIALGGLIWVAIKKFA
jgi:hypothetical protein